MAGRRIGYPAPRTAPRERVLAVVLLCLFLALAVLLVGACNHELQNAAWPGARGNGITSRMLAMPVA